ncbi:transposase, partial [Lacticaseibacillus paracasei]|nr:transposase [Lacticaseibacillus paracasei]
MPIKLAVMLLSPATNVVWVTDCSEITYGKDNKQRLRLSAVKDLH